VQAGLLLEFVLRRVTVILLTELWNRSPRFDVSSENMRRRYCMEFDVNLMSILLKILRWNTKAATVHCGLSPLGQILD